MPNRKTKHKNPHGKAAAVEAKYRQQKRNIKRNKKLLKRHMRHENIELLKKIERIKKYKAKKNEI